MGHGALIDGARVHSYYSASPSALCTPLALALAPSSSPGPVCAVSCVLSILSSLFCAVLRVLRILRVRVLFPRARRRCDLGLDASASPSTTSTSTCHSSLRRRTRTLARRSSSLLCFPRRPRPHPAQLVALIHSVLCPPSSVAALSPVPAGLAGRDSGLRTQDSGRSCGARVPGLTCFNLGSWVLSTLSPGFIVCGARPPVLPVPRPSFASAGVCSVFCVLCSLFCAMCLVPGSPRTSVFNVQHIQLRSLDLRFLDLRPSSHSDTPAVSAVPIQAYAPPRHGVPVSAQGRGTRDEQCIFGSSSYVCVLYTRLPDSGSD